MSDPVDVNDLIAVTLGQTKHIRLYIQFIADVNSSRALKAHVATVYFHIFNELKNKASCLGYKIECHLMPTSNLPSGAINKNFLAERDPAVRNPFLPYPPGVVPPIEPLFQEQNAFGNPVTTTPLPPLLPLIRFYIGDGESLTTAVVGEGNDLEIDEQKALAIRNYNATHGYAGVIPGYEFNYSTRTSFFSRELRAGYLFTGTPEAPEVVFMHELGHVLGLTDRYIEGIDDASPGHPFRYVGQAARRTPPLSKNHIDHVLNHTQGTAGPDSDYDPQNNLMSSRSYHLSSYQKSIIDNRKKETAYVGEDVMVLLFSHPACKRAVTPHPGLPCRTTETPYHATSVTLDPVTNLPKVTFQSSTTTPPVLHNAVFKNGPDVLPVRFQSETANRKILKDWIRNDGLGCEAVEMILQYFKYQTP